MISLCWKYVTQVKGWPSSASYPCHCGILNHASCAGSFYFSFFLARDRWYWTVLITEEKETKIFLLILSRSISIRVQSTGFCCLVHKILKTTSLVAFFLCPKQEQELVFLADFRCSGCQQRVTEIVSKMNGKLSSALG